MTMREKRGMTSKEIKEAQTKIGGELRISPIRVAEGLSISEPVRQLDVSINRMMEDPPQSKNDPRMKEAIMLSQRLVSLRERSFSKEDRQKLIEMKSKLSIILGVASSADMKKAEKLGDVERDRRYEINTLEKKIDGWIMEAGSLNPKDPNVKSVESKGNELGKEITNMMADARIEKEKLLELGELKKELDIELLKVRGYSITTMDKSYKKIDRDD